MFDDTVPELDERLMKDYDDFTEDRPSGMSKKKTKRYPTTWSVFRICLSVAVAVIMAFALGVVAGNRVSMRNGDLLYPAGETKVFMEYNSTFSRRPSEVTREAWASLFPTGKGFVRHPTLSPETSGLAVFHALHCVESLWKMYYVVLDDDKSDDDSSNHAVDLHHVRHCFDYLRQSIMCSADTNIEPVDSALGGTTGWNYTRTCRDFESVKDWAEKNWSNEF